MKLSTLCHWLEQSRRVLIPLIALALMLPLALVLPGMLWILLAAPVLLCGALYLLWHFFRLGQFPAAYQRAPRPSDALAQTVLVDAELVDEGLSVQAVAQPLAPATALSLRMGSGALLLGTAMTLLSDEAATAEHAAIHRAVTRLNIRPDRMKAHSPLLHREQTGEYTAVTVQDGPHERTYYLAEATILARLCSEIWEDGEDRKGARPITGNDRDRIRDAASYMAQSGGRVLAYATALGEERPTFLGLCALGQHIRMDAVQELARMKAMGLAVLLRDAEDPAIDTASLRRVLDIPDVQPRADICLSASKDAPHPDTLTIRPDPDQPLSAPILYLRSRFERAERLLSAFAWTLAVLLGCCCLAGSAFGAVAVTGILLCGARQLGLPERGMPPRLPLCITALTGCLLLRLFLGAALPEAAVGACGLYCILLGAAAALLNEAVLPAPVKLLPIGAATLACIIICLLLTGTTVLSAVLAVLVAAIVILLCTLMRRISR